MPIPKVSIVLLTYNHEQFIEQALDSILAQQTAFVCEIIVGEDCSTDRTRALVEAYQRRCSDQIKPMHHARNIGLSKQYLNAADSCLRYGMPQACSKKPPRCGALMPPAISKACLG
jgi:glycosyltransferase involved in cell wall biosynthesis